MDIQGTHNSTNVTDLEQGLDFGHGNIAILLETSFCCAFSTQPWHCKGFYGIKDPWEGYRRALRPILFEDRYFF